MMCSTCGVIPYRRQRPNYDLGWYEHDTIVVCDCEVCCVCGDASGVLVFHWEALPEFDYMRDGQEYWQLGPLPYGDKDVSGYTGKLNQRYCSTCYSEYHKKNPIINPLRPNCRLCNNFPLNNFHHRELCWSCLYNHATVIKQCQYCSCTYTKRPTEKDLNHIKTLEQFEVFLNEWKKMPPCLNCEHKRFVKKELNRMGLDIDKISQLTLVELRKLCYQLYIDWTWKQNHKEGLLAKINRYVYSSTAPC